MAEICTPGFIAQITVDEEVGTVNGQDAIAANQFVVSEDGEWQLEEPIEIATYLSSYNQGWDYYYAGVDAVGESTTVEIKETVQLCNVQDRWTLLQGVGEWKQEPILEKIRPLTESYPTLQRMSGGTNWQLVLETESSLHVITPVTIFWQQADGSRSSFVDSKSQSLYLEFLFKPAISTKLRSLSLNLLEAADETLELAVDATAISTALTNINQILEYYTRDQDFLLINSAGLSRGTNEGGGSATVQLNLITGCIAAFNATGIAGYRERALFLASGLLEYYYKQAGEIIDPEMLFVPHEFVNAVSSLLSASLVRDVAVKFVNGIAEISSAQAISQVYLAYTGQLATHEIPLSLGSGKTYPIDYWNNSSGTLQTVPEQEEIEINPQPNVIHAELESTQITLPFYSAFVLALV